MKAYKMPTTRVLDFFSWLLAVSASLAGGYFIILGLKGESLGQKGIFLFLGGLLLAALVRVLGNIGQMIFDLRLDIQQNSQKLNDCLQQNAQKLNDCLQQNAQKLNDCLQQVNCDTKDIAQNIHEIKTFFEQISRQMDLKK